MSVAVVVLAHEDPQQVRRLIRSLSGLDVFLHCDARAGTRMCAEMTQGAPETLQLLPRRPTRWGGWSIFDAELRGLQTALDRSQAEHIIVASGRCYPLVSVQELQDELASWRGLSRFRLFPLPYSGWNTGRLRDGGYRRLRWRYLTIRGDGVQVKGFPIPLYRRRLPAGLEAYGVSCWRIYARHHAAKLLEVLNQRRDLTHFFRTSHIPDELCPGSILRSSDLVGPVAQDVRHDCPWHIVWPEAPSRGAGHHPRFLTLQDLPVLREMQSRPRRTPSTGDDNPELYRRLFTRKIHSHEGELLDAIDEELRR
jgi:hypothetical protein